MAALHVANPGPLPAPADDPNRPPNTHPVGGNSPNWTDNVAGHTIVRSGWGNWSNYDPRQSGSWTATGCADSLKNDNKVTDAEMWRKRCRPEILKDFQTEIYGKIPKRTPKITWEVLQKDDKALDGTAVMKHVVGHIDNSRYTNATPSIDITLYTPANATNPVPTMVIVSGSFGFGGPGARRQILEKGWGYATVNTSLIQADSGAGLNAGIIGLVSKGKTRQPDDWGVLAAWSWRGLSRAIDYFATDKNVDARPDSALKAIRDGAREALLSAGAGSALGDCLLQLLRGVRRETAPPRYGRIRGQRLRHGRIPLDGGQLPKICRALERSAH